MIVTQFNWLAVLTAAAAFFALGAIWFNPKVFGSIWMKGHGLGNPTEEDKKRMPQVMGLTFLISIATAMAVGYFVYVMDCSTWMRGAKIGFVIGMGSGFAAIATTHLYTKKNMMTTLVDGMYYVAGAVICGVILSVWK